MKIFIPTVGTELVLAKPWRFDLHHERRNMAMFAHKSLVYEKYHYSLSNLGESEDQEPKPINLTLPVGTVLKIDRIYIRKGLADFDSVTFILKNEKISSRILQTRFYSGFNGVREVEDDQEHVTGTIRFWVKLDDVNKMEVKLK